MNSSIKNLVERVPKYENGEAQYMYAVIATGGKQYKVAAGDQIYVEKLEGEVGDKVEISEVLALANDDGLQLGDKLKDAKVSAEIVKHGKAKKIVIFKYKAKKNYRRKTGHRQPYTLIKINDIAL